MAHINVPVPTEVRDALRALADEDDRPLVRYVARLLKQHVDDAGGYIDMEED